METVRCPPKLIITRHPGISDDVTDELVGSKKGGNNVTIHNKHENNICYCYISSREEKNQITFHGI